MTPVVPAQLREVTAGVLVATSTIMATNTTVLTDGGSALLVDPNWSADELDSLATQLRDRELRVIGGFATHAHHDHLLWHPGFGTAPRWASPRAAAVARDERAGLLQALGATFPASLSDLMGRVEPVEHLPASGVPDGFAIELLIHDGHAPGHTALWLPRQRVLIAGDMLSDTEVPLPFWPDDLPAYRHGLERLAEAAAAARFVIPGHGSTGTDAAGRLAADNNLLDAAAQGVAHPADARLVDPTMRGYYHQLCDIST
ncbi:MBL fold metallo-hydrolase [Allobranchiibius sp. CTAmp26]|uniref:MBL fold metallo-hydrolase n=1 Tax=Allobranchiibius sp. CTAmp26 TaxID=2815214 RepID=UPI0027DDC3D9|nr:MBL fold metallo-hydrolase [Allobranchiibius sp. CTAmp26]